MTSIEPTTQLSQVTGMVHGGQQPVTGATIQLIAPGITGYGSAGTVIASTTTDGTGSFTLPSYTCPTGNVQTYLLATGGNPGAGLNSSLAEAAILGPCSGLSSLPFISISEVTTVAAAYTLAPFAALSAGTTNIGTSSTNLIGLANASGAAGNLANVSNGQAGNSTASIILPTAEMNTLADILASCVNSGVGGVTSSCSSLFTAATPPGGTAPTDTFQAAIDIALNPGNNESALYLLATPSAPYQPTLPSDPGDFALAIQYDGGIIPTSQGSQGIDIDAQGNAWFAVLGGGKGFEPTSGLMELTPSGVLSPSSSAYLNTMRDPEAVAISGSGLVEVADYSGPVVFGYVPPGSGAQGFSFSPHPTGGVGLAIDNHDSSFWVADYNGLQIQHFNSSGNEITTSSPLPAGSVPWGIAIDSSEDVVAADSDSVSGPGTNSAYTYYAPAGGGTYAGGTTSTSPGLFPSDVAFDHAGSFWLTVNTGPLVYAAGAYPQTPTSPQGGYVSASTNIADSIEIDGLGRAFVTNNNFNQKLPGTLTVWANNGTLISTANSNQGYLAGNTIPGDPYIPHGLALDASGNCWITGNTPSVVTELIGIAAPVATPLAVQNAPTNRIGVRP